MNLFLDTSAVVKLYHHEQGSENLLNFIAPYSNDLIFTICDLTLLEFRSALLRRVRIDEIPLDKIKQIFSYFDRDLNLMNIIETEKTVKTRAITLLEDVAANKSLKTLDSIQLASAIIANENLEIDYFVAADEQLLDIAGTYFRLFNPVLSG